MKKFLSVLLVIALCVSFTPAAFAYEGNGEDDSAVIVVGDAENGEQSGTPAETQPAEAQPAETAEPVAEPNAGAGLGVGLGGAAIASVKESAGSADELKAGLEKLADSPDSVLKLTDDIELSGTLTISKSVTVAMGGNELSFTGGNGGGAIKVTNGAEVTFRGGELTVADYDEGSEDVAASGYETAVYVENGSFVFDEMVKVAADDLFDIEEGSGCIYSDEAESKFTADPTGYLAEGYEATENDDGTWTVKPKEAEPTTTPEPTDTPDPENTKTPDPENAKTPDPVPTETPDPDIDTMLPELPDPSAPVEPTPVPPTVGGEQNDDGVDDDNGVDDPIVQLTPEQKLEGDLTSAADGATVTLADDVEKDLTLEKSVTLDLAGKTVNGTVTVAEGKTVTIEGGTVTGKIVSKGDLTLDGVELTKSGVSFFSIGGGSASLESSGTLRLSGSTNIPKINLLSGVILVDEGESQVNVGSITAAEGVTGEMKAGKYGQDPGVELIAEGYEYRNGEIMPMMLPLNPTITSQDGQTTYNAQSGMSPHVNVNKDKDNKNNAGANVDLVFKISSSGRNVTLTGLVIGNDVDKPEAFSGTDLDSNSDYTYDENTQTITIKVKSSEDTFKKFCALSAGYVLIKANIKVGSDSTEIFIPVFLFPRVSTTDKEFNKNVTDDTVTFSVSDKPKGVSLSDTASSSAITSGRKLAEETDYTVTGDDTNGYTVTVKSTALSAMANGTRYVALWYGYDQPNGTAMACTITVSGESGVTVEPTSTDWTYGSNKDVSFTLKYKDASGAEVTSVSCDGTALNASQYAVSGDKKTVTLKGPYLQTLVKSDGTGHGAHNFGIVTNKGTVTVSVNIKPLLSAKDGKNTHTKGTKNDLVFQSSAPVTGGVKVGNIDLKPGEYTVSSDGFTVTLLAEFLNQRGAGNTFTLRADTDYGTVSASFKVVAGTNLSSNSPATGDENNIVMWIALLALSGAAAVALLPKKKNTKG